MHTLKDKVFTYEDFNNNPVDNLKNMCKILKINFNDNFKNNLKNIKLTGDDKAIASTDIKIKSDAAPTLIKKEDEIKINSNINFIRLMENMKKYY